MEIYGVTPADAAMVTAHFATMLLAVFTYRRALDSQPVPVPVWRLVR